MEFIFENRLNDNLDTYLFESGVDQRFIQELLGHYSSKTTVSI
jgi:site-specific recombinase XerD